MSRFRGAVVLLLPSWSWIGAYWVIASTLLLAIGLGLKATGPLPGQGSLWGYPLHSDWGVLPEEILRKSYLELTYHVWTLVALPFVFIAAMRRLTMSLRTDFSQFLRFSRSSRIFIEGARIAALLSILLILCLPFSAHCLWALVRPGVAAQTSLDAFAAIASCTALLLAVVYLMAAIGVPMELVFCFGVVCPFLLAGFRQFMRRGGLPLRDVIPPGLPYSVEGADSLGMQMGFWLAIAVVVCRLLANWRTRWI